ncbi:MAG TPA: hypothetical protein VNM90_12315 [Haliangium sp.]|nr:hypothetical protein [Haliangium sp.]
MKKTYLIIVSIVLGAGVAAAEPLDRACSAPYIDIVKETFSDGSNQGNWGFGCPGDVFDDGGGNPGPFRRMTNLEVFAPMARNCGAQPSVFTGDYRKEKVFALSVDFKTFSASYTTDERPLTLVLVNHAGTPDDISDDLYVFYVGKENIPTESTSAGGWVRYQFSVPSDSPILPRPRSAAEGEPGWVATVGEVFVPAEDPDAVWNTVIQQVDEVVFWWHDPRYFAIFQMWDVGMDNPAIAMCMQ